MEDKCKGCNNVKACITCVDGDQWAHIEEVSHPGKKMVRWTKGQITTLRRMYPDSTLQDIAEATGQSVGAVYKKARLLGLQKSPEYNPHAFYGRYVKKGKYSEKK
jgi:hypothetical protein